MSHPFLNRDVWVLLCDASKAVLFQNAGDSVFPKLEKRFEWHGTSLPSHEMGTDRPGRTFSGKQGRHSAIQPKDLRRIAEREFLTEVTEALVRKLGDLRAKKLLIVAPAKVLGELRSLLPSEIADCVRAEIEKDYLRTPVHEIESRLGKLLSQRQKSA